MDPREAMSRIELIREQLARAETYRAFRAASTGMTGVLAMAAAAVQAAWQLNTANEFLQLWVIVAAAGMIIIATEMTVRYRATDSVLARDALLLAARQFVPCVVAGALLTVAVNRFAHDAVHLLPGLWAILFSLGIFASRPGLPRAIGLVGLYYLLMGLLVIATTANSETFEIWPMPVCFGVGQILAAATLYFCAERVHEPR
jgi:hypothetical protein